MKNDQWKAKNETLCMCLAVLDRKHLHSPIIKFSSMVVRPNATNRMAFYLMNTTQVGIGMDQSINNQSISWPVKSIS